MNTNTLRKIEAATPFLLSRDAIPAASYLEPYLQRAFKLIQILSNGEAQPVDKLANVLQCNPQTIIQTFQAMERGGYKLERCRSQWKQVIRACVPKDGSDYVLKEAGTFNVYDQPFPSMAYCFVPRMHSIPLDLGVPGIYTIKNIKTEKVYVGKAKDVRTRWTNHVCAMRTGRNVNWRIKQDWEQSDYIDWVFTFQQFALENRGQLEVEWIRRLALESLYNNPNDIKLAYSRVS